MRVTIEALDQNFEHILQLTIELWKKSKEYHFLISNPNNYVHANVMKKFLI